MRLDLSKWSLIFEQMLHYITNSEALWPQGTFGEEQICHKQVCHGAPIWGLVGCFHKVFNPRTTETGVSFE